MKKTYIKPEVTCIRISTETIIAVSLNEETEVNSTNHDGFVMQGREDRPSTPNIWDQEW